MDQWQNHIWGSNNIQHQAQRICTGALRITTAALKMEVGEMPLELTQIAINYWINLQRNNPDRPTLDILKPCWEKTKRETRRFG